jgi:hypothetical protein
LLAGNSLFLKQEKHGEAGTIRLPIFAAQHKFEAFALFGRFLPKLRPPRIRSGLFLCLQ